MKRILSLLSLSAFLFTAGMAFAADGATLYKSCAGCHGADGGKAAGGSTPLKGQTAEAVLKNMQGYADGTYGGKNKKVMETIAKKLPAEDMKAVSDYIGSLK